MDYRTLAKKLLAAREDRSIIEKEIIGNRFEIEIESRAVTVDKENHTVIFVMSSPHIDRHGDVIDQDTWNFKHFDKNPGFYFNHYSDRFPLGKWVDHWFEADPEIEGQKRLLGKAEFRVKYEDAARAFDHVVEGDLNMVSVGFIPHRVEYDEERDAFILYDCELLECSLVGIGSNRQALVADKATEDPRETIIEAKKNLESVINNPEVRKGLVALKARGMLNKAIRKLRTESLR